MRGLYYMGIDTREWVYSAVKKLWVQNVVLDYTTVTPAELGRFVTQKVMEETKLRMQVVGSYYRGQEADQEELDTQAGGDQIGQAGAASARNLRALLGDDGDNMDDGEPSWESEVQALREEDEAGTQALQGRLLRVSGGLQETDQHLEQLGMAAQGMDRQWEVQPVLQQGQVECSGPVGARLLDGTGERSSCGGGRQEGDEGAGPTRIAPGDAEGCGIVSQKPVSRKRKVHKVYDVKGDGGRKRQAGADEFAMLGLDEADDASSIHEGSALEGLRRGCKSSLRNG